MKWRLFRSLLCGGDPEAERLYRWHIEQRSGARIRAGVATDKWKCSTDDYVASAKALLQSMKVYGFLGAVPVDPDGELLDGSHRVAAASALGLADILVLMRPQKVWAPAWDYEWFRLRMGEKGLDRLVSDHAAMKA